MSSIEVWGMVDALARKITTSTSTATPQELAYLGTAAERIAGQTSMLEIAKYVQASKEAIDQLIALAKEEMQSTLDATKAGTIQQINIDKQALITELNVSIDNALANFNILRQEQTDTMTEELNAAVHNAASTLSSLQQELSRINNEYNAMKESLTPALAELYFMSSF